MLKLIPYRKEYAAEVSVVAHIAINQISDDVYSAEERTAWSFAPRSSYHWHKRLSRSQTWLMIDEQRLASGRAFCCGFINLETDFNSRGYIDSLYVHPDYQGRGVAKRLYSALALWAIEHEYDELFVDASKLSKSLFASMGFKLRHRSYQEKRGVVIMGYYMSKVLKSAI
ncbi:GCN5-related N-acetyltransferase [Shewanella halifaxensis HAW-EB4]|uniref:GCN5-related N-acetyltransferase n=1 Tax=Shewanella halifaxensis (strain HAW-EB4) TaxID=458817 RepID=B0TLH7_SHEHH|nr:GNAT family N-acetyltransferase [Shewanella halifaxensis]ABZ75927.1 GCN5-related N-acetyltransferase [Shewanella halifaxensis HAW-EB4]